MRWKNNRENAKDIQKKQSVSSTTSMSILRDENLTFHRFATDVSIDNSSRRTSSDNDDNNDIVDKDFSVNVNRTSVNKTEKLSNERRTMATTTASTVANFTSSTVWSTASAAAAAATATATATKTTTLPSQHHHNHNYHRHHKNNNYTTDTNDFQYVPSSEIQKNGQTNSMAKLVPSDDEDSQKQSKCSVCRSVIFCLCLNLTYANVVRFPREFEHHGMAFLIPYFTILLLIGLPTILLEISLGQFLGQDAAYAWRASPILKGASIIGRIASWLCTIWTSLQAIIAIVYIGELIFKPVPFSHCATKVRLDATTGYVIVANSGQECMNHTFMTPVWEHTLYFALMTMSLVVLWFISMICTYSGKTVRRSILLSGILSILLLCLLTGWKMANFFANKTLSPSSSLLDGLPQLLSFDGLALKNSTTWFNALVQVIFSTTIGTGCWPVLTGKFLHKGDAVRTSLVYLSFNILIVTLSTTFFMIHYDNPVTVNASVSYPELMPLTVIYDSALAEHDPLLARILPGLAYLIIVVVSIASIALAIYTASRIVRRHPNYILSFCGLMISIAALLCPNYMVSRLLDTRIVGVFVICALIFDVISITWIYGAKTIYTDLEFSIGRPIMKGWVLLWCITPVWLTILLTWWAITMTTSATDLAIQYVPRWLPIIICLAFIMILACVEVYKQVDYNCCSMIQEAASPSKDWGPADPIVRHAWKQWTSVCEDTGQKDFTLRRRGTRDYTHSIKRGQYSRANMDANFRKVSTPPGSCSPNYSGSVFDDSAIEEDAISGNNSQITAQHNGGTGGGGGRTQSLRQSNISSRRTSATNSPHSELSQEKQSRHLYTIGPLSMHQSRTSTTSAGDSGSIGRGNNVSKIEIISGGNMMACSVPSKLSPTQPTHLPNQPNIDYRRSLAYNSKNSLPRISHSPTINNNNKNQSYVTAGQAISSYGSFRDGVSKTTVTPGHKVPDNYYWNKYSVNAEEYSTEL